MSDLVVSSLGTGNFLKWGSVDSGGQAGGILVFWIAECWSFWRWKQGSTLSCVGSNIAMIISFGCFSEYMGQSVMLREKLCGQNLGICGDCGMITDALVETLIWSDCLWKGETV